MRVDIIQQHPEVLVCSLLLLSCCFESTVLILYVERISCKMFMYNFSGGGDSSRPSFFEMMAQQQMMPTFKPALKYIFSVCIHFRHTSSHMIISSSICSAHLIAPPHPYLLITYTHHKYYIGSTLLITLIYRIIIKLY